jgi:hypothetical protein
VIPAGQGSGRCGGVCFIERGTDFGRCTCVTDLDCAPDVCNQGQCTVSLAPCVSQGDCRGRNCVDTPGPDGGIFGSCLIGKNCLPAPGKTCADVGP